MQESCAQHWTIGPDRVANHCPHVYSRQQLHPGLRYAGTSRSGWTDSASAGDRVSRFQVDGFHRANRYSSIGLSAAWRFHSGRSWKYAAADGGWLGQSAPNLVFKTSSEI